MHPARFESTIPASERQQTHASERAVTGIGQLVCDKVDKYVSAVIKNEWERKGSDLVNEQRKTMKNLNPGKVTGG
jgi:hypothetical protein